VDPVAITALTSSIASLVGAIGWFIHRHQKLKFYRHVYDTGGAKDVEIVARATKFELQSVIPGQRRPGAGPPDALVGSVQGYEAQEAEDPGAGGGSPPAGGGGGSRKRRRPRGRPPA